MIPDSVPKNAQDTLVLLTTLGMILNNKSHLRLSWSTTNIILKLLNLHIHHHFHSLNKDRTARAIAHCLVMLCMRATCRAHEPRIVHASHTSCMQAMHCAHKRCVMHVGDVLCRWAMRYAHEQCIMHVGDASYTWLTHCAWGHAQLLLVLEVQ